eukprot:CAMPEP_0197422254 /NCGR_PEP_ID=MMETSP1170-20131217/14402_1 /TAXON_ID=54406 /ORGANISM="Sarcinochrysis sp, Strain CCMP770" /LENGTH=256 /DNA_ID=CAMNT_0042949581 /DNA_START=254 /DNA_END=1021 /DNA_ORIENTATION=+
MKVVLDGARVEGLAPAEDVLLVVFGAALEAGVDAAAAGGVEDGRGLAEFLFLEGDEDEGGPEEEVEEVGGDDGLFAEDGLGGFVGEGFFFLLLDDAVEEEHGADGGLDEVEDDDGHEDADEARALLLGGDVVFDHVPDADADGAAEGADHGEGPELDGDDGHLVVEGGPARGVLAEEDDGEAVAHAKVHGEEVEGGVDEEHLLGAEERLVRRRLAVLEGRPALDVGDERGVGDLEPEPADGHDLGVEDGREAVPGD